jgi:long-chain acyl-CoA synthetase
MERFNTLPSMLQVVMNKYHNSTHMNYLYLGKWEHISTGAFADMVRRLALGLKSIGVKPGEGFGILADPSPQWIVMDLAIMITGGISVPLFPNISPDNLEFEIADSNMKFLYIAKEERWEAIREKMKSFNKIVAQSLEITGNNIIHFIDVLKLGDELSKTEPDLYTQMRDSIKEDDVTTIIYTSGSTGKPKGVELTHKNLVSQIYGAHERFPLNPGEDKILSCLPLAHIFERMVMYYYLSTGCSIYFADDIRKVGDLLREIHPTIIPMVPRLLEKVHAKMAANVEQSHGLKKKIASFAFNRAQNMAPGKAVQGLLGLLADRLVYSKLRTALGGKLGLVIVGGAAMPKDIGRFFMNIGLPLYEGYGQTEASPVIAANYPRHRKLGTVGPLFPGVEIKISDNREILVRGPNVMRAYHNNEEETKTTIDEEGFLHTGDMGELDNDGYLTITGRIKELFKTSSGKYVSPIPIEQALAQHDFVDMACVIAEGRNFTTCLVFPNFDNLGTYKEASGYGHLTNEEFFQTDFIHQEMSALLLSVNHHLNHWEKVQKFRIIQQAVSPEGGELTPTMKIRRHIVNEKYGDLIEEMYKEAKVDPEK